MACWSIVPGGTFCAAPSERQIMQLVIKTNGAIRCLYAEAIDLSLLGSVCVERGSHVEPDDRGRWFADLSPVAGPLLGPFTKS